MSFEHESEAMLEEKLIKHLQILGYEKVSLKNIDDVKNNFRKQIIFLITIPILFKSITIFY